MPLRQLECVLGFFGDAVKHDIRARLSRDETLLGTIDYLADACLRGNSRGPGVNSAEQAADVMRFARYARKAHAA
jgi:hypothetical protein